MTDADRTVLDGRYELTGLLGRGGMATVWRGVDRVLGREVAIKVMHSEHAGEVDRQRFAAETRVLARLDDPHLVTLLDAGIDRTGSVERPWLVMELIDGPSLARRFTEGPLGSAEAARVGESLALALAHVHAHGIVHRDVKPANVLLASDGEAKLADFGIARMVGETSDLTATGETIGTAAYLAPEQLLGTPVTGASDIYALGLVLLEALTGRRAYVGSATEAAMARLHRSPLIPISLGVGWVRLLDEMTAREPDQRPSAADVAARLSALRAAPAPPAGADCDDPTGTIPLVLPPPPPLLPPPPPFPPHQRRRRSRRLPLTVAAAAVALLALLVGGAAWVHGGTGTKPPAADADVPSTAVPTPSPSATAQRSTSPTPTASPRVVAKAPAPRAKPPAKHPTKAAPAPKPHKPGKGKGPGKPKKP